jgi:hypothetical protein
MHKELYAKVSKEELKLVFSFHKGKCPEPDKWLMEFSQGFYDMVEESRLSKKVLGSLNSSFLALITKKDTPSFDDFRHFIV